MNKENCALKLVDEIILIGYCILHLWSVRFHLRGVNPVVCIYHLVLLLQHEETTKPVCSRNISKGYIM